MFKSIRTAVIGVGNMGKHHARIYRQISDLIAVSDISEVIGKKVATDNNCRYYSDYQKMINVEKPDCISVAVPTKYHKQVAIYCLNNKVACLVEKPIADNINDAKAIIKQGKNNNTLLLVGHIERFNPAVIKLKEIIDKKRLGAIVNILAVRAGIEPMPIKNADVTKELTIHDVDIFNYLINDKPIDKYIIKTPLVDDNIADLATIIVNYPKCIATAQTNWMTPIKIRKLYVTGTAGFAELDYISQKLCLYKRKIGKKYLKTFSEVLKASTSTIKEVYISKKEPLKNEIKYFLNQYQKGNIINCQYAVDALELLDNHGNKNSR